MTAIAASRLMNFLAMVSALIWGRFHRAKHAVENAERKNSVEYLTRRSHKGIDTFRSTTRLISVVVYGRAGFGYEYLFPVSPEDQ
jgi:hypothetical protein